MNGIQIEEIHAKVLLIIAPCYITAAVLRPTYNIYKYCCLLLFETRIINANNLSTYLLRTGV